MTVDGSSVRGRTRRGRTSGATRRRLLLLASVLALVVASGCVGVLGQEELHVSAEPIAIDEDVAADAGFEHRGSDSFEVDETVDVGGQERRIVVTSHTVTLQRQYRGAPLGHLVAMSTPQASVLGQGLNPLGLVGPERLVERVLGQSAAGGVEDLDRTGNVSMRALGEERTVERFDASGERGTVQVYLTRFEHGEDYVIVFGVVPEGAEAGEEAFRTVLGGVRHDSGES